MFEKKIKVRHKTEGWTGELEVINEFMRSQSSHGQTFEVTFQLWQDSTKPDGSYVEDPDCTMEDLEIIASLNEKEK